MGISYTVTGSTKRTEAFLKAMQRLPNTIVSIMQAAGHQGVQALASATPYDSGLAEHSWNFEITAKKGTYRITWTNSDVENGFPVVIMLQYGYGTGTGGYVHGRDFINPAIQPIFDEIADKVWKAVTSS